MCQKAQRRIVSLFSGCGGLDLGFVGGFRFARYECGELPHEIIWANEIDKYACQAYRRNLGDHIIEGDIWKALERGLPEADILLGGFPCQDFSWAGKRKGFESERGRLYQAMVEAAKQVKPEVFIAENVKGILSISGAIETIKTDFSAAGFPCVEHYCSNATDHDIPQNRERVFIIGWRREDCAATFHFPPNLPLETTPKSLLHDLEETEWDGADGHRWALAKRRPDLQGNETTPADGIAYTIRAEHHMNIQFHYNDRRRLSVREAARLQSFPDGFSLAGLSKHQAYKMIGNAVPPFLAWRIASEVARARLCI